MTALLRRLLAVSLPTLLLGGAAIAQSTDRILLQDGSVLEGEIVEAAKGKWWIVLEDGRMASAAYDQVQKVERAPQPGQEPASDPASDEVAAPTDGAAPVAAPAAAQPAMPDNVRWADPVPDDAADTPPAAD